MIFLKNKLGEAIDSLHCGRRTIQEYGTLKPIAFFDVDNDNINEVFWAEKSMNANDKTTTNFCKSVQKKNL